MRIRTTILFLATFAALSADARAVTIDWSPVGNPSNAADQDYGGQGQFGAVANSYRIGTYEVTNSQYVAFLNAKDSAGTNPLGLYNGSMTSDGTNGGINFALGGLPGSKYSAKVGHENQPVNYVSWYDSIRFANWLNNGQGNGSTEIGAYTLGNLDPSGVPTNGPNITRNSGASVFLPSENEWYKAAYYDPNTSTYNLYPTSSSLVPTASVPTGASNSGNFNNAVVHLTAVGVYTSSASPYGTFDQGGNVWEWNEASKSGFLVPGDFPGTFRTLRGGAFDVIPDYLRASARIGNHETDEGSLVGFRVASIVPEPSSLVLAAFGFISLAAWSWRRRKG